MTSRPRFKVGDVITYEGSHSVYTVTFVGPNGEPHQLQTPVGAIYGGPWMALHFRLVQPKAISSKEDMEALYG